MGDPINDMAEDVKVYGRGSPGGKGMGLIMVNRCRIPRTVKIPTRILSTSFYDRYLQGGNMLDDEDRETIRGIVDEFREQPIGVRSSATNEAGGAPGGGEHLHAGEYRSFMLPNNHPDAEVRLGQVFQAIEHIFTDFARRQETDSAEKMAVLINPIPGMHDETDAGPCFYPSVSGIANSFFPYALKSQDPADGFARIAFGHGYATIQDDFPIVSMATIRDPIPLKLLQSGNKQQYFYALDTTCNTALEGEELETMTVLHTRFARRSLLEVLGLENGRVTLEHLIQDDRSGFRSALVQIMETIKDRITPHFQIEFVFNLGSPGLQPEEGEFTIVQLTQLPRLKRDTIRMPEGGASPIISIANAQGHGTVTGIQHALVVSPFVYTSDQHDRVREGITEMNEKLKAEGQRYLLIVPGRLGSANQDWGIFVTYAEVSQAAAIFEYGVDIAGRAEPLPEKASQTGGAYGSHFLYMIQGGFDEDRKRMQTRMYGTQGTHFLTNLVAHNTIYGFIAPTEDHLDPLFFSTGDPTKPLSLLTFQTPLTVYADSLNQRCRVVPDEA